MDRTSKITSSLLTACFVLGVGLTVGLGDAQAATADDNEPDGLGDAQAATADDNEPDGLVSPQDGELAAPVSMMAGDPDVLRVKMYNSRSVTKSTCQLMGYLPDDPMRYPFALFVHDKSKSTKVFSKRVPCKYKKVAVVCRANGPTNTVDVEYPYGDGWVRSSCASSQPDTKCSVYTHVGDP